MHSNRWNFLHVSHDSFSWRKSRNGYLRSHKTRHMSLSLSYDRYVRLRFSCWRSRRNSTTRCGGSWNCSRRCTPIIFERHSRSKSRKREGHCRTCSPRRSKPSSSSTRHGSQRWWEGCMLSRRLLRVSVCLVLWQLVSLNRESNFSVFHHEDTIVASRKESRESAWFRFNLARITRHSKLGSSRSTWSNNYSSQLFSPAQIKTQKSRERKFRESSRSGFDSRSAVNKCPTRNAPLCRPNHPSETMLSRLCRLRHCTPAFNYTGKNTGLAALKTGKRWRDFPTLHLLRCLLSLDPFVPSAVMDHSIRVCSSRLPALCDQYHSRVVPVFRRIGRVTWPRWMRECSEGGEAWSCNCSSGKITPKQA